MLGGEAAAAFAAAPAALVAAAFLAAFSAAAFSSAATCTATAECGVESGFGQRQGDTSRGAQGTFIFVLTFSSLALASALPGSRSSDIWWQ